MSRRPFRLRHAAAVASRDFGPNMTPMVDIVMVILIFFMAGSAFIGPEWFLDVAMAPPATRVDAPPEEKPDERLPPTRLVVRLSRGPSGDALATGLGLEVAPIAELEATLRRYAEAGAVAAMSIVVEPARDVSYQDVIRVYDLCQQAGVSRVALAKATPPAPPPPY